MKISLFSIICSGSVVASDPDGVAMLQNRKINAHKHKKSEGYGCAETTGCESLCSSLRKADGDKTSAYDTKQSGADKMSTLASDHSGCLAEEKKLLSRKTELDEDIVKKSEEVAKKGEEVAEKGKAVAQIASKVAKKAGEVAAKREEVAAKREEVAAKRDAIAEVADEIAKVGLEIKDLADTKVEGKKCKKVLEKEKELGERAEKLGEKEGKLGEEEKQLSEEEAKCSEEQAKLIEKEEKLIEEQAKLSQEEAQLSEAEANLSQQAKDMAKQSVALGEELKAKTNSCTQISENQKIAEQEFVVASDLYTAANATWAALVQKRVDVEALMQARTSATAARESAQVEGTKTSWQVRIKTSSAALSGTDCPVYVSVGCLTNKKGLTDTEGRHRGWTRDGVPWWNPFPKSLGHEHNHHENGQVDSHTIDLSGPPSDATVVLGMHQSCNKLFPGWKVEWFEFGGERLGGDVLNYWLDTDCRKGGIGGYKDHQHCRNAWAFTSPKIQNYFDAKQVEGDAIAAHDAMCGDPVAGY